MQEYSNLVGKSASSSPVLAAVKSWVDRRKQKNLDLYLLRGNESNLKLLMFILVNYKIEIRKELRLN
jgi:hypothetical protein